MTKRFYKNPRLADAADRLVLSAPEERNWRARQLADLDQVALPDVRSVCHTVYAGGLKSAARCRFWRIVRARDDSLSGRQRTARGQESRRAKILAGIRGLHQPVCEGRHRSGEASGR